MDHVFWAGIVIGAILSFAASIAAALLNDRIQEFARRHRKVTSLRRRSKETTTYGLVHALKTGRRSQVVYFTGTSAAGILNIMGSMWCSAIAIYLTGGLETSGRLRMKVPLNELSWTEWYWMAVILGAMFASLLFVFIGSYILGRAITIGRRLDDFEGYKARLCEQFPDFDLDPDASAPVVP